MFIGAGRFTYYFLDEEKIEQLHLQTHHRIDEPRPDQIINGRSIEVNFIGANQSAVPQTFGKSLEYYNYLSERIHVDGHPALMHTQGLFILRFTTAST